MSDLPDPVRTITNIYEREIREVPYPLFMRCFDRLVADFPDPTPAAPSAALKKYFRAVCMAVQRGIADTEGRGEDRTREFLEKICPVWEKSLPKPEFAEFRKILQGGMKRAESRSGDNAAGERPEAGARDGEQCRALYADRVHRRFERAFQDALREQEHEGGEGIADGPEEHAGSDAPGYASDTPSEAIEVPVFESETQLYDAVLTGKKRVNYTDAREKKSFAAYMLGNKIVQVRLLRTPRSFYLDLAYPEGFTETDDADRWIIAVTSRLGYSEVGDMEYRLEGRNFNFSLKFGARSTHLACRTDKELSARAFAKALRELDNHLNTIIAVFSKNKTTG